MAGIVNKVYSVFRYTTIRLLSPQPQLDNYAWQINKRTNKNVFFISNIKYLFYLQYSL